MILREKLSTGLIEWRVVKYGYGHCRWVGYGLLCENTVLQLLKGGNWLIVNEAAVGHCGNHRNGMAWEIHSTGAMILKNAEEIKKYINNQ